MLSLHAQAADIALYPTGPDQDSAFLRFINAADRPLQLLAEGSRASLKLEGSNAVSDYLPVPANQPIKGTLERNGKSQPLDIQVAAGEFASVIALPDSTQGIVHPGRFARCGEERRPVQGGGRRQRATPSDQPGQPVGSIGLRPNQRRCPA
jgi:hypothetical protein